LKLIITCEHGGNRIPPAYRPAFRKHRAALESHRGYDPGALALARELAKAFDAELVYSTTSRLLVELNRSPHHRQVLSEVTRALPREERERLLQRYYWPYRNWVEAQVAAAVQAGEDAIHISSHSFTPRLDGVERRADIGLLYDPARPRERALAAAWRETLRAREPSLTVRRNYPYRGSADGLTTHLRRLHPSGRYAGIEIEVNQKHTTGEEGRWRALRKTIVSALGHALKTL
jgi:predicted N-formylglutamate amidohydrolase